MVPLASCLATVIPASANNRGRLQRARQAGRSHGTGVGRKLLSHALREEAINRDTCSSGSPCKGESAPSHTTSSRPLSDRGSGICSVRELAGASSALVAAACIASTGPAFAADLPTLIAHTEPSNALSLPTWAIHVSSVVEWTAAIFLMWEYAEVSGNERWKGMSWGMLPCLLGAMCACTWHFFYNNPDVEWLVFLQSLFTFAGNCTCWWAAYRIYKGAIAEA